MQILLPQGKSTFLQACLGEVDLQSGGVWATPERTAFCSQDSWLRNESIRSAIIFSSEYEETWYRKVIRAVSLDRDIEVITLSNLFATNG